MSITFDNISATLAFILSISLAFIARDSFAFDENDMLSIGSSAIENIESVPGGSLYWRAAGKVGGRIAGPGDLAEAEARLQGGASPDSIYAGLGAKALVGVVASPLVRTTASRMCKGGGLPKLAICGAAVTGAAVAVWKASESAGSSAESGMEALNELARQAAIRAETSAKYEVGALPPPADAVECGSMAHYSQVGGSGCGTENEEPPQVADEGFNGVWRQASAGQDGMLLQVTDDSFSLKLGKGMESCGTITGTFSLKTADDIAGSFTGRCADLNMQGSVGMQRSGDEYTLTNCVSMATGTPDTCSLGYFATAERAE